MQIVIYGDFNCPFSALASSRVARLEQAGTAQLDGAPSRTTSRSRRGRARRQARARAYKGELEQVDGLLLPDETLTLRVPPYGRTPLWQPRPTPRPNPRSRAPARIDLFRAYWEAEANLADPAVLDAMGLEARAPTTAADWRTEWLAFDRPLVPVMQPPDGHVSRGLGALADSPTSSSGQPRDAPLREHRAGGSRRRSSPISSMVGRESIGHAGGRNLTGRTRPSARLTSRTIGGAVVSSRLVRQPRSTRSGSAHLRPTSRCRRLDASRRGPAAVLVEGAAGEPAPPRGRRVGHRRRHRGARDLGSRRRRRTARSRSPRRGS